MRLIQAWFVLLGLFGVAFVICIGGPCTRETTRAIEYGDIRSLDEIVQLSQMAVLEGQLESDKNAHLLRDRDHVEAAALSCLEDRFGPSLGRNRPEFFDDFLKNKDPVILWGQRDLAICIEQKVLGKRPIETSARRDPSAAHDELQERLKPSESYLPSPLFIAGICFFGMLSVGALGSALLLQDSRK